RCSCRGGAPTSTCNRRLGTGGAHSPRDRPVIRRKRFATARTPKEDRLRVREQQGSFLPLRSSSTHQSQAPPIRSLLRGISGRVTTDWKRIPELVFRAGMWCERISITWLPTQPLSPASTWVISSTKPMETSGGCLSPSRQCRSLLPTDLLPAQDYWGWC